MQDNNSNMATEMVGSVPKYRLGEGKVVLEVEKVTPRQDGKEGVSVKFSTLIKGREIMPGLVEPDRTKYYYMWVAKGPEVGKKIPCDLSLFVIKRSLDEWVVQEGDDAGEIMETTKDTLELRAGHPSGL